MSPDLEYYISKLRDSLPEGIESIASSTDKEAEKAIKEGDRRKAIELLQENEGLKTDAESFHKKLQELSDFINEHPNLKRVDIGVNRFLKDRRQQPPKQSTSGKSEDELFYEPIEKPKLESIDAQMFLAIVQRDEKQDFVYSNLNSIIKDLRPEATDPEEIHNIKKELLAHRKNFTSRLAHSDCPTIQEFVQERLGKARSDSWITLYKYMAEEYGSYTLEEFATLALFRFSRPEKIEQIKELFVKKTETTYPYISDARATALTALIEKDPEGNFAYELKEIARGILSDNKMKEDKIALSRAYTNITNARWTLKSTILQSTASTMQEFTTSQFGENLETLTNPAWRSFYEKILLEYGNLPPQQFIDQILYRNEEIEIAEDPKGEVYNTLSGIDHLSGIKPVHEITLFDALARPRVIERIEALLEKPIEDVLREGGWNKEGHWDKCLEASAKVAGRKRERETDHPQIGRKECFEARQFVAELIRDMVADRDKYKKILELPGINGFRFMFCIAPELAKNKKVEELINNILFPLNSYRTDNQGYI